MVPTLRSLFLTFIFSGLKTFFTPLLTLLNGSDLFKISLFPFKFPYSHIFSITPSGTLMSRKKFEDSCRPMFKDVCPYVMNYTKIDHMLLVIDARSHGNDARFVRRSCAPNAEVSDPPPPPPWLTERGRGFCVSLKLAGQHSLNKPPSFLFRYIERLVRSTVYLPKPIYVIFVSFCVREGGYLYQGII